MNESEFGKGLTYCIGLFLAHEQMFSELLQKNKMSISCWFNGASDHLYQLDTSQIKDEKLKEQIDSWATIVKKWGHGFPNIPTTKKDMDWVLQQAKDFLRQIDEIMLNTPTIKGNWE